MAMVGINGSPGVRNCIPNLFCGCLEIIKSTNMMEIKRNVKKSPNKVPLNPIASIKSMKNIHPYIMPTNFVTYMPVSVVAGPGFIQGYNPGHKYEYS